MSSLSSGVAFLPESECKSIADFRPAQAFRDLFFRNVHKTLIFNPYGSHPRLECFVPAALSRGTLSRNITLRRAYIA